MPNLSVGLSSMSTMSAMPILTPIPVNPLMHSVQPLMPTPMTLPLITSLGNSGLPNGNINLLTPPLVPSNAGWFCSGTILICLSDRFNTDIDSWFSTYSIKLDPESKAWQMLNVFGLCSRAIQIVFISCNRDSLLARVALRLNAEQENPERWKRLFYPSIDKNLVLYVCAKWLLIFTCAHAKKATTGSQIAPFILL